MTGYSTIRFSGLVLALCLGSVAVAQNIPTIDPTTAAQVLPDAEMAQDAFSSAPGIIANGGWHPIDHGWDYFFAKVGLGWETNTIAATGFYARIYQNASGNITIAFRSTTNLGELWTTDVPAQAGIVPQQYVYAAQLVSYVKKEYPRATVTLTGHSLAGGLATYAAQQVPGITNVVTFNSARPPIFKSGNPVGVNQINVLVPGDTVGDPQGGGGKLYGSGYLPGRTYSVDSPLATSPGKLSPTTSKLAENPEIGSHSLQGIEQGLQNAINQQPRAAGVNGCPSGKSFCSGLGRGPPKADPSSTQSGMANAQKTSANSKVAPGSQTTPATTVAPTSKSVKLGTPTTSQGIAGAAAHSAAPGGISLGKAAAEQMPIDIDLDGAYYEDGRLVLSGQKNSHTVLDAALLLTAVRAACEPDDPYFSLDPENGTAWLAQGQQASQRLWDRISRKLRWNTPMRATRRALREHSLWVRTISAGRDYPELWSRIAADYPDLRSKLVFRPTWLRQTRFGEIMYEADVLLKELASGAPVLSPDSLPAAKVPGYVSELSGQIDQSLFAGIHNQNITPEWQASRFWFDVAPRKPVFGAKLDVRNSFADRELLNSLRQHHMIDVNANPIELPRLVMQDGPSQDLSQIYPTMFVRRNDPATGKDLPVNDPIMNSLSNDINDHIEQYVRQYRVLQSLTEVVRAYVAAVHIIKLDDQTCSRIRDLPLFDSEKTAQPLPQYRPSELIISIARYAYGDGRSVRTLLARSTLVSGGVTIAGKAFYSAMTASGTASAVIRLLNTESPKHRGQVSWSGPSDREFVSFNVFAGLPRAPVSVATDSSDLLKRVAALPSWAGSVTVPTQTPTYDPPNESTAGSAGPSDIGAIVVVSSIFGPLLFFFFITLLRSSQQPRTALATANAKPGASNVSGNGKLEANTSTNPVELLFNAAYPKRNHATIIAQWMETKRCSRFDAMRFAVEDWRRIQSAPIPMPDLSSPASTPYVPPSQRDASLKTVTEKGTSEPDLESQAGQIEKSASYGQTKAAFDKASSSESRVNKKKDVNPPRRGQMIGVLSVVLLWLGGGGWLLYSYVAPPIDWTFQARGQPSSEEAANCDWSCEHLRSNLRIYIIAIGVIIALIYVVPFLSRLLLPSIKRRQLLEKRKLLQEMRERAAAEAKRMAEEIRLENAKRKDETLPAGSPTYYRGGGTMPGAGGERL